MFKYKISIASKPCNFSDLDLAVFQNPVSAGDTIMPKDNDDILIVERIFHLPTISILYCNQSEFNKPVIAKPGDGMSFNNKE